jgi:saccharopine dehydrogenase-like NADP-dependent oxidoreductase
MHYRRAKKILLIGSGLMAETLIDTLLKRTDNHITIASLLIDEANQLVKTRRSCSAVYLDVSKEAVLLNLYQRINFKG